MIVPIILAGIFYALIAYIAISTPALPLFLFVVGGAAYFGVFNQFVAQPKRSAK